MALLDADPAISAMVLTGSEKAFAAGADIKEMAPKSYMVWPRHRAFLCSFLPRALALCSFLSLALLLHLSSTPTHAHTPIFEE